MKAPHNSRWHTAVGSPLPRSARAKSITVRRVYERAEDEEKKRKTRARTHARDEIFTLLPVLFLSRAILPFASALPSREGNFISAHRSRLCTGNTPLAERGLSIILELLALIGNQSSWPPPGGATGGNWLQVREHCEFLWRTRNSFVKNIFSSC